MERSCPTPTASRRAGWPGGSDTLTGGAPTAAAKRHLCWTAAAGYMYVLVCICTHMVSECAPMRRLSPSSPSCGRLAGGSAGKEDLRCCFFHPPWQLLGWRLGWIVVVAALEEAVHHQFLLSRFHTSAGKCFRSFLTCVVSKGRLQWPQLETASAPPP